MLAGWAPFEVAPREHVFSDAAADAHEPQISTALFEPTRKVGLAFLGEFVEQPLATRRTIRDDFLMGVG